VSPLNGELRAAGIADITGYDLAIDPVRVDVLRRTLFALYPDAKINDDLQPWSGLRAMTHDGPPLIFGIPDSGIWINAGHGSLGWTFACAAAKIACDLVTANRAEPENPFFGLAKRWHG
jgi:D-amino-acid dehydrogenase